MLTYRWQEQEERVQLKQLHPRPVKRKEGNLLQTPRNCQSLHSTCVEKLHAGLRQSRVQVFEQSVIHVIDNGCVRHYVKKQGKGD